MVGVGKMCVRHWNAVTDRVTLSPLTCQPLHLMFLLYNCISVLLFFFFVLLYPKGYTQTHTNIHWRTIASDFQSFTLSCWFIRSLLRCLSCYPNANIKTWSIKQTKNAKNKTENTTGTRRTLCELKPPPRTIVDSSVICISVWIPYISNGEWNRISTLAMFCNY